METITRIGIIGAMEDEVSAIRQQMNITDTQTIASMEFCCGTLKGKEAVVVQCGMGKVNAGICAQMLISVFGVNAVVNTGVAGSLNNDINIGDKAGDPVVGVSDLLIHLASKQLAKTGSTVVEGEQLDLLVGSIPADEEKDPVKANILKLLKDEYDIEEDDFMSAEIEVVPAGKARDYGLDRSMIMGYGHDDKVCAYTSLKAIFDIETPERTACCILVDKEEIGSVGNTGMQSRFFEFTVAELLAKQGEESQLTLFRCLSDSRMLSSDVSAAYDPLYPEVMEAKNSAYFGKGICFNKFTGRGGKSGSNDANAEFVAKVRRVMDDNDVMFQTCELGSVDAGGGGTIAYILANLNMDVIDAGIAVQNMHAPNEVVSKADVYEAYRAYIAFLKDMD